jgi:hypothetical protein
MKKYFGMSILAVLAVILGGIYFSLTQTTDPAKTGQLFHFSKGEGLSEISVTNHYGSYIFIHENEKWIMTRPDQYRVNQEKVSIMSEFILNMPINRELDNDLVEYGLTSPNATVKIVSTNNKEFTFHIGNLTPSKAQVYLKDAQSGKVYICDIGAVAQFDGSLASYRDKEIFSIDKTQITRLVYYEGSRQMLNVERVNLQDWKMTFPYTAPARSVELNELTGKMLGWVVAGYPDENTLDLAAVGLEHPLHILEVSDASGESQRLEFGKSEEGMIYVRTGSSQDVVKLFTVDIDFTRLSADKLLFLQPLRTTIDQVASIDLEYKGEKTTLKLDQSRNPPIITLEGNEIPYSDFLSFFIKYTGLSAEGNDPETKVGELIFALKTTHFDGSTQQLKLFDRDENSVFMDFNGEAHFYMNIEQIKQLLYHLDIAKAANKGD